MNLLFPTRHTYVTLGSSQAASAANAIIYIQCGSKNVGKRINKKDLRESSCLYLWKFFVFVQNDGIYALKCSVLVPNNYNLPLSLRRDSISKAESTGTATTSRRGA